MTVQSHASARRTASLTFFVSPGERRLITRALRRIEPGRADALLRALGLAPLIGERAAGSEPPSRLR